MSVRSARRIGKWKGRGSKVEEENQYVMVRLPYRDNRKLRAFGISDRASGNLVVVDMSEHTASCAVNMLNDFSPARCLGQPSCYSEKSFGYFR